MFFFAADLEFKELARSIEQVVNVSRRWIGNVVGIVGIVIKKVIPCRFRKIEGAATMNICS